MKQNGISSLKKGGFGECYPFGMLLPGRNSSEDSYRYGFQGQEMDDEIKGEGNSANYKYRMHDTRVGRFFAVDPLAPKYPHNGPYNFSENIVLNAIELEGLEAFFIHGMSSTASDWYTSGFKELGDELLRLANYKTINKTFDWSGDGNGPMQTPADRQAAAESLVEHVLANKKEGEEVTFITASHGGNVAIIAAKLLNAQGYKVNIITFNRTSFNEEGYIENPAGNEGINDFIDIRTENDKASNFVRNGDGKVSNEYDGPGQKHIVTNNKKFFLNRHATKNVDVTQVKTAIDEGDLVPLKSVDPKFNPPTSKTTPIGPVNEDGSF